MKKKIVCIFGCWDLIHTGHLNILEKAKSLGDILIVGVFTDKVIAAKEYKGRPPIITCEDRARMLQALKCVNSTIVLEKREYIPILKKLDVDVLAVGEDWGKHKRHIDAEEYLKTNGGKVIQLPYTKRISTTKIKKKVLDNQ